MYFCIRRMYPLIRISVAVVNCYIIHILLCVPLMFSFCIVLFTGNNNLWNAMVMIHYFLYLSKEGCVVSIFLMT